MSTNSTPPINVTVAEPQIVITTVPGATIEAGGGAPPGTLLPLMASGSGAVGTSVAYAREDHVHPSDPSLATTAYVNTQIANLSDVYMRWVRFTGPGQSFMAQDMTRDGDWTMVAIRNTSDRPAPQPSGNEEDLLPAWAPVAQNVRATFSVANEFTLNVGGWIDQYGVDVNSQNANAVHAISLSVNGVVKDSLTTTPNAAGMFWQNVTPIVVASGTVIRVQVQVTQIGNNYMYWDQQVGLFASPPTYCSLARGSYNNGPPTDTAYDCHVLFIPGSFSPDWDIVAYGG
jgi:hypothetical protein